MPGAEAWQAFAGVVGVLIFLSGGAVALRRLGVLGPKPQPAGKEGGEEKWAERLSGLEKEIACLKLHMAENYVRRDDYVTSESRVIGLLETHSVMLARLEERIGLLK